MKKGSQTELLTQHIKIARSIVHSMIIAKHSHIPKQPAGKKYSPFCGMPANEINSTTLSTGIESNRF